jgi:hypothetical protein
MIKFSTKLMQNIVNICLLDHLMNQNMINILLYHLMAPNPSFFPNFQLANIQLLILNFVEVHTKYMIHSHSTGLTFFTFHSWMLFIYKWVDAWMSGSSFGEKIHTKFILLC